MESHVFAQWLSRASRCECLYTWVAVTVPIDIQNRHLGVAAVVIWKQLSRFLVTLNANTMPWTHHFVP